MCDRKVKNCSRQKTRIRTHWTLSDYFPPKVSTLVFQPLYNDMTHFTEYQRSLDRRVHLWGYKSVLIRPFLAHRSRIISYLMASCNNIVKKWLNRLLSHVPRAGSKKNWMISFLDSSVWEKYHISTHFGTKNRYFLIIWGVFYCNKAIMSAYSLHKTLNIAQEISQYLF